MLTPEQSGTIDEVVLIISKALKVAAMAYPPIAPAIPVLNAVIALEARKLKGGLADGSIVPDSQGGFIPAHGQSIFDPKTGRFTGGHT